MSLLDGLDADQQRAVTLDVPALCVLAGAGSGKTRVLTRRVARRIADESAVAEHTLVLTFTRKAATELRDRLRTLGVDEGITAGTFHSVAYAQLRQRYADQGKAMPAIATNTMRIIEPVLEHVHLDRSMQARAVANEIAWAKSHGLTPETYERGVDRFRHRVALSLVHVRKVYEGYEWYKRKRHLLDYEDLLLSMGELMRSDRRFADAQRWKFRHFFVDEFQDLNHAQFQLLQAWMQRDAATPDIFLVGDSNQSIYGWNGADSTLLQNIQKHIPAIETVRLQKNYRSTSQVLAAAHSIVDAGQELVDGADVGAAPVVRSAPDEKGEAEAIARAVRQAHFDNRAWRDIAVLVRTNAQRSSIEEAFTRFGVPFQATGGAAWLSIPAVRAAIEDLRATSSARLATQAPDIETLALDAPEDDRPGLEELAKAARVCLLDSPIITVSEFLAWVEVTYRFDAPTLEDRRHGSVTVTTFHRAKGLEWPVVFLAGVEEGLVPLGSNDGPAMEEERRLFYVAITRAREELHISWAKKRSSSRGVQQRQPSPWLAPLLKSSRAVDAVDVTDDRVHEYLEEGRTHLHVDRTAQPDADVRLALERWRAGRMKLTGLPARHVLADDVIEQLVTKRPRTVDEVADIPGIGKVRAMSIGPVLLTCLHPEEVVS